MAYSLSKFTTTDAYRELLCRGSVAVDLQIFNSDVAIGFGKGDRSPNYDDDEHYGPMILSVPRSCDAIRVKSFQAGVPAVVTIIARTRADVG